MRKIAIVGLAKKDRVILKAAIETASGFETGLWELSDTDTEAQALILDPDSPQGGKAIERFADKDDAPLFIGVANTERQEQSVLRFMIEPPLIYKNILVTLRQIDLLVKSPSDDGNDQEKLINGHDRKEQNKIKIQARVELITDVKNETEPERQIPEVSEVVSIVRNEALESVRLHHLIKDIINEGKSVEIRHSDFPTIKICSEKQWFIFSGDLGKQTDLFRTRVSEFIIEDKGDEIRKHAFSSSFPKALWELVYIATLEGTEGELQTPLLSEDRLHLAELPKFEMAPHNEEHLAIADYMINHSVAVAKVASDLEIELCTVIDFSNACQALGLLIVTGEPQNKLFCLINRIIEQKKSVEITHPDFPTIDICSEKDWFIFSEDLSKYADMFSVDVGEFSFEDKGDEIRKQAFSSSFPKSLWELVYTATMFGTEGKLLEPLQATDRLNLIKKPEFEYVSHTKEHIVLADYMTLYTDTVHEIAVNTGVELKDVINFSNMCQAIHMVERNTLELASFFEEESETGGNVTIESMAGHSESKASKFLHSLLPNLGKKDG